MTNIMVMVSQYIKIRAEKHNKINEFPLDFLRPSLYNINRVLSSDNGMKSFFTLFLVFVDGKLIDRATKKRRSYLPKAKLISNSKTNYMWKSSIMMVSYQNGN